MPKSKPPLASVSPVEISDGLVRAEGLLWSKVKASKPGRCAITGESYPRGAVVFKPITNTARRMLRMTAFAVEQRVRWIKF